MTTKTVPQSYKCYEYEVCSQQKEHIATALISVTEVLGGGYTLSVILVTNQRGGPRVETDSIVVQDGLQLLRLRPEDSTATSPAQEEPGTGALQGSGLVIGGRKGGVWSNAD